jgi:hypothetical protein
MAIRLKTTTNRAPTVSDPPDYDFILGVDSQVDMTGFSSDPDGDATTLSIGGTALPTGFSFTGNILYWNGVGSAGVTTGITITASDGSLSSSASASFSLTVIDVTSPSTNDGFPRMAAYRIGTRDWGVDPELTQISKLHWVIINSQEYRGASFVTAKETFLDNVYPIAASNNFMVYEYTDIQEASLTGDQATKLDGEVGPGGTGDWWVYSAAGAKVSNFPGSYHTNITTHVTADSNGDKYPAYYGKYVKTTFLDPHNPDAPTTYRCGIFDDVFDHRTKSDDQDFRRVGTNDYGRRDWNTPGTRGYDASDEYREGHKLYVQQLKTDSPGMLVIGNNHTWGTETLIIDPNDPNYPPLPHNHYGGLLNGGIHEGMTGWNGTDTPWRFPLTGIYADRTLNATFGTWRRGMAAYLYQMRSVIAPRHVGIEFRVEITTNNRNPVVGTDMTADAMAVARFGMCFTWLDDGYVFIADETSHHNRTPLFDEMGVSGNESTTGLAREWGGSPITSALSVIEENTGVSGVWLGTDDNGVFYREFAYMLVLVNSQKSTTGSRVIPVAAGGVLDDGHIPSGEWYLIDGVQDPAINTGQRVDTTNFPSGLTLEAIDGRVLVRAGYSAKYP